MIARRLEVDIDQANKHDKTSGERVDKKLECDLSAVYSSPSQADKINWNQCHFPEDIKKKAVERTENPNKRHLHKKHQAVERRCILVLMFEGGKNDQWRKDGRQQHEDHTYAINTDMEVDPEGCDPRVVN